MKKTLAVLLSMGMLLSLAACKNDKNEDLDLPENELQNENEEAQNEADNEQEGEEEQEPETVTITKEMYEQMTADELFDALIKSTDVITLDEYLALLETYQYVDITDSLDLKKNITDTAFRRLNDEYWGKMPVPRDWVPLMITHEAPQVRGQAFGNAYYLYGESPEFVAAAKEVMKTETEPYVLYYMMRQMPSALIANDPEITAFVQEKTEHENALVQHMAKSVLENAAKVNQ